MMLATFSQPLKVALLLVAFALAVTLAPAPAMAQQATTFGSNSGIACPSTVAGPGSIICNGSINFLTTELFFEPETPAQGLKEALVSWNEVEYLLDNPYPTNSTVQTVAGAGATVTGAPVCNDGSGRQPLNEQDFPTYCTPTAATSIFGANIRRPAFGVTHPVRTGAGAGGQGGTLTNVLGLSPLRVHPLNYNAPNGNEQRVLNPKYAGTGTGSFNNTGICYTLSVSCTPPNSVTPVSPGVPRLDPTQTPEIDYDVSIGAKPFLPSQPGASSAGRC
jgi:hypothetical protein